jgi:hypothetical protein
VNGVDVPWLSSAMPCAIPDALKVILVMVAMQRVDVGIGRD